ncbi:ribosomal protein L24 [Planctopirus limnophila DSM 3776]|uniref:Large ribosomal subunit protein uL24 n=1 Tax=Planctopirus limnophila (strain ATCC 43296 / DSM 3776 / IFAM 1008 / Mu 290) TaxID=521674 RepID=D5SQ85_PLAL2|nr:50S ribosomal protein L24 [Planctopirus limnophila]ADG66337.1 ribosomal protein L24 [Planctopirus limnophila DSM 3776]
MRIRKGDMVVVLTGDDASATPRKVLSVVQSGDKVVVEGVNRVFKHVRRGHPKSQQGGRLSREMPVSSSNVAYYCSACGKPTRIGMRLLADGRKERFCKKCDASIGVISPAPKSASVPG